MLRICSISFSVLFVSCVLVSENCRAELTSPQIGWQAELSTIAHGVSGTVTILDEDSIQVDDFNYDGGGISVYFYLGMDDTQSAFTAGIPIGPQLKGTSFDGTQGPLVYDLPLGNTLEGLRAISVWCVAVSSSFGTGTFNAVSGPSADFDEDGDVDGRDFLIWQRGAGSGATLADWQEQYGEIPPNLSAVPEPSGIILASLLCLPYLALDRN